MALLRLARRRGIWNANGPVYWKEWFGRALRETAQLFRPFVVKVAPPLVTPALLYLEFGMGGLVSISGLWKTALCLVESYALVFVAMYVWNVFRVVPIMLKERDVELQAQAAYKPPPLSVTFTAIGLQQIGPGDRNIRMRVDLSIRTTGFPATLHSWAIRSALKPDLKPLLGSVIGLGKHVGGNTTRLDEHDVGDGALLFEFVGLAAASETEIRDPRHAWELVFSDAYREYRYPIPGQLYAAP